MVRGDRRWSIRWLVAAVVGVALVGAIMGAWAGTQVAPTYAATTSILVGSLDRPSIATDFAASSAVTTLYGDLIRGQSVLGPVIDRLGLATNVAELRDRVHVDLDPNGIPIVTITVYARSAAEATATAQAVADRMVAMSRASFATLPPAPTTGPAEATDLQVAITRVERKLTQLREQAAAVPPKHRARIERRVQRQTGLLLLLQTDYRGATRPTGSVNQLQVLQPAEAKPGRIRPLFAMDAALGAVIAALAACSVLVVMAMRRRAGAVAGATGTTTAVRDPWAREILVARQEAYAGTAPPASRR